MPHSYNATEQDHLTIAKGHPPMADKLILIDFDGTIAPFGFIFDFPEPLKDVALFTQMMKRKGYKIGIFTSRLNKEWLKSVNQTAAQHIDYITSYNNANDIKFDFITSDKYPAEQIFDDKATNVHNNWGNIILDWSNVL